MNKEYNEEYIINLINNIYGTDNLITFTVKHSTIPIYRSLINKINGHRYNCLNFKILHRDISIDNILNDDIIKNVIISGFDNSDTEIERFVLTHKDYNVIFPAFKYRSALDNNYIITGGKSILYNSSLIIDIKENGNFLLTKNRYSQ